MKNLFKILFLFFTLFVLYLGWFGVSYTQVLRPEAISQESNYCYLYKIILPRWIRYFFIVPTDSTSVSELKFFESGKELTNGASLHESIRKEGRGRFSHWNEELYFSSSDNTNPNANGREYRFKIWVYPSKIIQIILVLISLSFVFQNVRQAFSLLSITVLFFAFHFFIYYFFYKNALNPILISSKMIHILIFLFSLLLLLFFWFLFERTIKGFRFKKLLRFLFLGAYCVSSFAIFLESFFRIVPIWDTSGSNPAVYHSWPDFVYYPLNNYKHRDRDFLEKKKDTFRVLALGDSYTEGSGMRRNEAWPGALETRLISYLKSKNITKSIEVFNLGHSGFNTKEEVELFKNEIAALKPNLAIFAYVINDAELHNKKSGHPSAYLAFHKLFIEQLHSYSYYWFYANSHRWQFKQKEISTKRDIYHEDHDPQAEGWKNVQAAFKELKETSEKNNIPVLYIIFPDFSSISQYSYPFSDIHEQVLAEIKKIGISGYDIAPHIQIKLKENKINSYSFSKDDGHPNQTAHGLIADFLLEKILEVKDFKEFFGF